MGSESNGWRRTAIVTGACAGVVTLVTTLFGFTPADLGALPEAAERHAQTRANTDSIRGIRGAVDRLDQTLRIYACGDTALDRSTRIRLRCREFDR